jgi:hypothetical protein
MDAPLDLLQLYEVLGQHRELIANTWQFFVSVHIAIFGLLFMINPSRVSLTSRLVLFFAYSGFMYLNYNAQVDNYTYARELIELAFRLESLQPEPNQVLTRTFSAPGWLLTYLPYIFIVAMCVGGALILIPNRPGRMRQAVQEKIAKHTGHASH